MMRRVTCAFVATVALLGALILPTVPSASAAAGGSCSIVVSPTVWVGSPYTMIPATLGPDCAANAASFSIWNVRHSYSGPNGGFLFDNTGSDSIGFYDWEDYGTYYVEPGFSYDADYNDLAMNTRSFVVKSGSGLGFSAVRTGRNVALRVSGSYYSPALRAYTAWRNEKVVLQYKTCPACTWKYLRNVYTASNGTAAFTDNSYYKRYYRAIGSSSQTVWPRTSTTLYR